MSARDQGQEALSWLSGAKEDVNRAGQGVIFLIHPPFLLQIPVKFDLDIEHMFCYTHPEPVCWSEEMKGSAL